jgi:endonuclease/exonuclease/phosphatase (EEP) superfamily protein YafD
LDDVVSRSRAAWIANAACRLAVAGWIVTLAISFVPFYPCTLFEHFRVHYAIAGLPIVVAAFVVAPRGWSDTAAIALLLDALLVLPDLRASRRALPAGTPVRLLVANVLTSNQHHADVRALIETEQPDVVALIEVDRDWLDGVAPALASYPHRIEHPRGDNFGLALYARQPVTGQTFEHGSRIPSIIAELSIDETRTIGIAVTHPLPPIDQRALEAQQRHFDELASRVRAFGSPAVIAGDLNATPWSRAYAHLRGATGMCDSRAGFGYQGSYPTSSWLLRIPIDHVFVSCSIGVRDRRIGPHVGSDHFPVIVDLVVPR